MTRSIITLSLLWLEHCQHIAFGTVWVLWNVISVIGFENVGTNSVEFYQIWLFWLFDIISMREWRAMMVLKSRIPHADSLFRKEVDLQRTELFVQVVWHHSDRIIKYSIHFVSFQLTSDAINRNGWLDSQTNEFVELKRFNYRNYQRIVWCDLCPETLNRINLNRGLWNERSLHDLNWDHTSIFACFWFAVKSSEWLSVTAVCCSLANTANKWPNNEVRRELLTSLSKR